VIRQRALTKSQQTSVEPGWIDGRWVPTEQVRREECEAVKHDDMAQRRQFGGNVLYSQIGARFLYGERHIMVASLDLADFSSEPSAVTHIAIEIGMPRRSPYIQLFL
jgi:hypothetical protein